ncbi:MAG: hypothetical protein IPI60_15270 [Saprospiraceae bacterium]|nr:hypothetical protein [Saprospiraceae bacterium]
MRPIPTLLFFLSLILCTSCGLISIDGSLQGLNSYYNKTKADNPNLLARPDNSFPLCELKTNETPKVYVTNAAEIASCFPKEGNAIVYIWRPNCSGKLCYSLNLVQEKCNKEKIDLFIVAEYYHTEKMEINYKTERPVFGIDTKYYRSNLTSKYLSKFRNELTGTGELNGQFLLFRNGVFYKSFKDIEDIDEEHL